jgi:Sec-independent protein translocase protein TatA
MSLRSHSFKERRGRGRLAVVVAIVLLVGGVSSLPAFADQVDDRLEALERAITALQAELAALRAERAAEQQPPRPGAPAATGAVEQRLSEVERRQEIQAEEIERLDLGPAVVGATEGLYGLGDAASKVYRVEQGLSIGGYGEMLFESIDSTRDDGSPSGVRDRFDFLRGVLYTGYKFNDEWVFNSEIEVEHASTGSGGEVSLEFAYVDRLLQPGVNARAGLLLVPMGFVNEIHEPPLFLGAKRPDTERVIIPTTWRENGLGIFGEAGPFTYRTYMVNGLRADAFTSSGLRSGRQKGAQAIAEDFAWVGRLDYTATPGLLAGASVYAGDSGQGLRDASRNEIDAQTTIVEGHVDWEWRGLEARALYAEASIDDVARLNQALNLTGSRSIGESLEGYYVQLGYDLFAHRDAGGARALIPYARWEFFDTQAEVPTGFSRDPAREVESFTLGIGFRPIDQVIFKLDHQDFDNEAGTGIDQWNVSLGYLF